MWFADALQDNYTPIAASGTAAVVSEVTNPIYSFDGSLKIFNKDQNGYFI